jgi:hypothetical protein
MIALASLAITERVKETRSVVLLIKNCINGAEGENRTRTSEETGF